jgi:predicted ferric reductase
MTQTIQPSALALPPPAPSDARARVAAHRRRDAVSGGALALAGAGLGVALGLHLLGRTAWVDAIHGQLLNELGRVAAIVGSYGTLMVLLLAARIPWLEAAVGQDRLLAWHRRIAPWSLGLVGLHVVLNTLGYALGSGIGVLDQVVEFLARTPWMLPALAGLVLMAVVAFSSMRVARARMTYETWWVTHLYAYLAVALAFLHQVRYGQAFVGNPWATRYWTALNVLAIGSLVLFRWGLPLWRSLRHDLRVTLVARESADTVTVHLAGRRLDRLPVRGGQYLTWRFAVRGLWWQGHPYSLSAAPDGRSLRITVKDLGDHSAAMAQLRPGTRAFIEGPYGALTAEHRITDDVVLVAGGVGITPVRALLEELPAGARVELLYRAPRPESVVLHRELDAIAASRPRTRVRYLVGSRREFPLDARWLEWLVPWVARADLYVCGPLDLERAVVSAAEVLGIPAERVHTESFTW